jgi:hypothetical protein
MAACEMHRRLLGMNRPAGLERDRKECIPRPVFGNIVREEGQDDTAHTAF